MNVTINQKPVELPEGATVAHAIEKQQAKPPYAVAVNLQFVPKTQHASHALAAGDAIEIISPVTGG